MAAIFCYGDSNTAGFDPRSPFGETYDFPWCKILAEQYGITVINAGENGKTIPTTDWEFRALGRQLMQHSQCSRILIMLGTNDLLHGYSMAVITNRINALLGFLHRDFPTVQPILLSPPPIDIPEFAESAELLSKAYSQVADTRGILFLNTQTWNLPLSFDGVHLSEDGHRYFAEQLYSSLCT